MIQYVKQVKRMQVAYELQGKPVHNGRQRASDEWADYMDTGLRS